MNVKIIASEQFSKNLKRLVKKFASLKNEIKELQEALQKNPRMGIMVKENIYKIRLAVKSKGKGKSGGMRIITYVIDLELKEESENTIIYLLTIYDKSESENISDNEIDSIIKDLE